MLCNRTHGMPRGDFNVYFASSRRGNVRAEEYVSIVILKSLLLSYCRAQICIVVNTLKPMCKVKFFSI